MGSVDAFQGMVFEFVVVGGGNHLALVGSFCSIFATASRGNGKYGRWSDRRDHPAESKSAE